MHVLDNFITEKFLKDISKLLETYKIEDNIELLENIIRKLYFSENSTEFQKDFRKIYNNLYQRNFTILEVLAIKQQTERERQVFSILKNHISENYIRITWPNILNIFISYKNQELIQHPDPKQLFPVIEPLPQPPPPKEIVEIFLIQPSD